MPKITPRNDTRASQDVGNDVLSMLPLHAQVRETIRHRILDGSYAAHAQMPSESQMMAAFGVSRVTIRQALGDLQKEGLIFKVAGKGMPVSSSQPMVR